MFKFILNLLKPKKKTNFVSELDKFLSEFDVKHPKKSDTQLENRQKHLRIFRLRDNPNAKKEDKNKIWSGF